MKNTKTEGNQSIDKKLFNITKELLSSSKRVDKEIILNEHKEDEDFLKLMKFMYDTNITFGIKKLKLNKFLKEESYKQTNFSNVLELLDFLEQNNTGRDSIVQITSDYIKSQDKELFDFLGKVVTKNLKTGVTAKTLNKTYEETFIPLLEPMRLSYYKDNESHVEGKEFYLTQKLNGVRMIVRVENGKAQYYSRQGKTYTGFTELDEQFKQFDNAIYDGEMLIVNHKDYKGQDVMQRTNSIISSKGEKIGLCFNIFDTISISEWDKKKGIFPYSLRREYLDNYFYSEFAEIDIDKCPLIRPIEVIYKGKDTSVIQKFLEPIIRNEDEGLVLNISNAKYCFGRTKDVLKVKESKTLDLKIIDFYEGKEDGNREGTLGGFVVDYVGQDLKVGSGLTQEIMEEVWNNKEKYLGMYIEIEYSAESKNKQGKKSVAHPAFKRFREDKKL